MDNLISNSKDTFMYGTRVFFLGDLWLLEGAIIFLYNTDYILSRPIKTFSCGISCCHVNYLIMSGIGRINKTKANRTTVNVIKLKVDFTHYTKNSLR